MARTHVVGALAALLVATQSSAQQVPQPTAPVAQDSTKPAGKMDSRLRAEIALISTVLRGVRVPDPEAFRVGNTEVAAGATEGPMAVARGNLVVKGRVTGDVLVLHGDITVLPGGSIAGSAVTVDGRVHPQGGVIEGDVRAIRGVTGSLLARAAGRAAEERPASTVDSLKMALGWFAVLFVIGVGVLLFAEKNLDGVVLALEQDFGRSFWTGVLAQLAALPALLLVGVALCITLIGILLVPFAVVAFIIGLAGLLTLGFLAVSRFAGRVFFRREGASTRMVSLQSLFAGLAVFHALWFVAAFFVWSPVTGALVRALALGVCWVAVTFGLGATLLTRAGTRKPGEARPKTAPSDALAWQTPTPVTGVAAARRPVATVKEG